MRVTSGEGFAVLTLICSLIEFLHSCYEGKMFDVKKTKTIPKFYFGLGQSKTKFTAFLKQHEPFKSKFDKTFKNSEDKDELFADDFYSNVRCGLLHSAETKNGWKIKTYKKNFEPESFVDLSKLNEKIIYRDKFFEELKTYCAKYKKSIINNENNLRDNFCRKLDDLCEIYEPTQSWWQ